MAPDDLEHLADEACRRPVGEPDATSWPADPDQLCGGALGVGGEHDAEGRQDGVEGAVVEGQVFGVGDADLEGQAVGLGAAVRPVEEILDVVGGGHRAAAARRGQRRVAVAGGDVKDPPSGGEVDGLAQRLADDLQSCADDGVVAAGPGCLLAAFDGLDVGAGER